MDSFFIPRRLQRFELEIKRSRFVTSIAPVTDVSVAQDFIRQVSIEFADASHNCWAYVAGPPDDVYQIDKHDDGEPKGTAGKPMLNVLLHSGLGHVAVVVTRYFGGIKLGAGGLVRAYSHCVSDAISELETVETWHRIALYITLPYALLERLEHSLIPTRIEIADREFGERVSLCLHVPELELADCRRMLDELGQGQIVQRDQAADESS